MNISEANAVATLLRALDPASDRDATTPDPEWIADQLAFLAGRAGKALMVGLNIDPRRILDRLAGVDSDGEAQAVCRAIAAHLAHNGALPWPSIRKPYDAWAAAHDQAVAR
jgi:hypothetical protein